MRRHVYQAVVWPVLAYGLPLWYRINGKGCKNLVKLLIKTQNAVLRWLSGAFRTMPIPWMELVTGIAPVEQRANYTLCNALQRGSRLDHSHVLNIIARSTHVHPCHVLNARHSSARPDSDNIHIITRGTLDVPSLSLADPAFHIGSRVLDLYATRV